MLSKYLRTHFGIRDLSLGAHFTKGTLLVPNVIRQIAYVNICIQQRQRVTLSNSLSLSLA